MADLKPALEQALRALKVARVSALHPDSVSMYTAAIIRAEVDLANDAFTVSESVLEELNESETQNDFGKYKPLKCECHLCIRKKDLRGPEGFPLNLTKMILCSNCGNKRCPKASDHSLECTESNSPNQPGSVYRDPVAWRWCERNYWYDWTTDWTHYEKVKSMGFKIEYAYPDVEN
jgi:hypothetical protein